MTTRTKLKERVKRNKKILVILKQLFITFSFIVFTWLVINSFNSSNVINISNTVYECLPKGCDYSFTVTNLSDRSVKGYARITVFKTFNIVAINSDEILSTERLEFEIKATEKKIIKGFYVTRI